MEIYFPKKLTIVYFSKNDHPGLAYELNKETIVQLKSQGSKGFKFVVEGDYSDLDKVKFVPFDRNKVALPISAQFLEGGNKKSISFSSDRIAFVAMLYPEQLETYQASVSLDPYIN